MHDPRCPDREHLTSFALDRLLAGETENTAPLHAHLAACAHCRERLAAFVAEQRVYMRDELVRARVSALMAALSALRARL